MIEITKDVKDFISVCSKKIGDFKYDSFYDDLSTTCSVGSGIKEPMSSPIEHLFYCAYRTLAQVNFYEPEYVRVSGEWKVLGLAICPQHEIEKYRVDFMVYRGTPTEQLEAIVECDGHNFHDRDERQRRYEKQRDRFLQSKGYRIFHFTGSEIKENPWKCAAEVIAYLTNDKPEGVLEYING